MSKPSAPPGAVRSATSSPDLVGERRVLVLIGIAAVFAACLIFAAARLFVTVRTGLLTPWWANAAGAVVQAGLFLWYRADPARHGTTAAHITAAVACAALVVPVFYGMTSSIWWLSLVGFSMVLLGRPFEARIWAMLVGALVIATVVVAPSVQVAGAAGEPPLEAALARVVFVLILMAIAAGFRKVANDRARALAESAESLERAGAARNRFLAHMSHEVRTPLHGVISMTELALRGGELPNEVRSQVQAAHESARVLLGLLNNVLDVTRAESDALVLDDAPFALHSTLAAVLRPAAKQAATNGLSFSALSDPGVAELRTGDPYRVSQVALNLVGNALKFTQRGGVVFRLKAASGAPDRVALQVADTGLGIPADRLASIFEPFTQARAADARFGDGTGLGLAIVQELATKMNGRVTVESEVGRGTTFTVELHLPRAQPVSSPGPIDLLLDEAATVPQPSAKASDRPDAALRVLVVEDNLMNQRVVNAMLDRLGHTPTLTETAEAAWDLLSRDGRFDVLLTDIELPGMDGTELVRRLRAREAERGAARLRVVAGTAHVAEGERRRLLDAGIDVHLPKPFDLAALEAALKP